MATRHIKRLQQQLNASKQDDEPVETSEEEESEDLEHSKPPFNPFDLLEDDDDQEEASAGSDSDEEGENGSGASEDAAAAPKAAAPQAAKPQQQQGAQPASKKQQQQPAGKGSSAANKPNKAGSKSKQAAGADDDIDKLLKELNMAPATRAGQSTATGSSSRGNNSNGGSNVARPPLLGIDPKRIRGDEELRRIFGAGVIEAVDRMEGGASGRRGGAAASARAAVRRRQLKKFMLVTPADHWPNVDSGLGMKQAGTTADGKPQFCYTWSPNYAAAQRVFEQAQASYDPNAVGAVLAQFPYHVDSLLAMNELYRSMGEAQTADDLLCRALYALEGAWVHGFDPTTGNVRLDFENAPNRGLFLALFRHAQALSRRGCHASALEVTKLLLALDPEDPVGGLLLLDYLALRAGAYDYLERFVSEFDSSHSLALLPNYAFALPMARFRLEQAQEQQQQGAAASSSGSSAGVSSLTLLAQALLLHPLVLVELVGKLQGQGAAREEAWQQLKQRKLYAKASDHGSNSLGHLISLFVERSHQLWKSADVLHWLQVAATAAADVADGKPRHSSLPTQQQTSIADMQPDDVSVEGTAEDWACVAKESFPAAGRNEYGHLRLADFSDAVNALPQEEMQAMMAPGGPGAAAAAGGMNQAAALEVLNDMLEQEQLAAVAAAAQRGQGAPAMSADELRATNPLLMLLQSMLPWVNAGEQPDYAAAGDGGAGQQQQQQGQGPQGQPPEGQ